MADVTAESRRMVMKWVRSETKDPNDPESALKADTIEEAYEKYDWLFVFEATMVTHMHADFTVDERTILERQEKAINKLKNMKHEQGSIQVWLQKFDDAIEECETMGATVIDEMKRIYLMKNLNEKIFEQTLVLWRGVLMRKSFPDKYDALKAYVMKEYSSQMTQAEHAKIIYNVISTTKKKTEPSLTATDGKTEKAKCHVCGQTGHKMKKCWYYDPKMTLDENKKAAEQNIKEKQAAKKEKAKEAEAKQEPTKTPSNLGSPAEVYKGTVVQLPPKEKTGMCLVRDVLLYCEPCNRAGLRPGQVDFAYDSGTASGVMGEQEMNILQNVEEEDELGLVGMHIRMDRAKKQVIITQPKHVERIIETFEVVKGAPSPALGKLMADDVDSPLLKEQAEYMSKCAMLMFISQRTYPEIRPAVIKLSTKYNKVTEDDMRKAVRVAEYIYGCKNTNKLVLNPNSMRLVSAADASYAEHPDGKSHSGGVVGFESDTSCYFGFVSLKQPVVAKSAGEAELIAQNKVGDLVEWARELLEELGFVQDTVPMSVDSTCAMQMVKQGTGSFKRAKHIKVRYFWLKGLIDEGMIELIYTPTEELVPVKNRIVPLSGTITCSVLLGVLLMCCCVFHILKPYISRKLSFSPFDSCRIYGQRTCTTEVTSRKVRICTDFANIGCWHNRKIQLPGIVCRCRTYTRHKLTYNILGHAGRA
jgi:hypothetical protein